MTKARWIGLGIGVVLILTMIGVVVWQGSSILNVAGTALAQGTTPTPTPGAKGPKVDSFNAFMEALAKRLGITVDDLKKKVSEASGDVIDQWVKDGRITQEQANTLKERLNTAPRFGLVFPKFGHGPFLQGHGPGKPPLGVGAPHGGSLEEFEAVAKVLKLSPAELTNQLHAGKTYADIAKAQGVDEAAVKKAIIDVRIAQIDRAVQDGVMTKEQADKLKANLTPDKIDLSHGFYAPFKFHR